MWRLKRGTEYLAVVTGRPTATKIRWAARVFTSRECAWRWARREEANLPPGKWKPVYE